MDRIINRFFILVLLVVREIMAKKKKKLDIKPRNLIYILIIILIVAAIGYFIFSGSEDSEDILSVRAVNLNKQNYIDKEIKVEGIFHSEGEDYLAATPPTNANPNPEDLLQLNLENIDNDTRNNLTEEQRYVATGTLTKISQYSDIVELVVTDIKIK